jgi:hypothetical protein
MPATNHIKFNKAMMVDNTDTAAQITSNVITTYMVKSSKERGGKAPV